MNSKIKVIHGLVAMSVLASAVPVLAQTTPPPTTGGVRAAEAVDLACVQSAITKRDNAIIAAVDTFHDATKAALQARRDALVAAWGITDRTARRAAIRTAWGNYKTAVRAARKALNEARRGAWKQYRTDRRVCGGGSGDDSVGAGVDAQL